MSGYHILGLEVALAAQVRRTMVAPEYGHPAVRETARGTGPCRVCLQRFRVGEDERLLFTYRPQGGAGSLGAPGPVFIHANECPQYRAAAFPADLYSLPLVLEAWATGNRIPQARHVSGDQADAALRELFADPDVAFVHVRHGEAGCHIARVNRGRLPAAGAVTAMATGRQLAWRLQLPDGRPPKAIV